MNLKGPTCTRRTSIGCHSELDYRPLKNEKCERRKEIDRYQQTHLLVDIVIAVESTSQKRAHNDQ
jgi:hypothetical protein